MFLENYQHGDVFTDSPMVSISAQSLEDIDFMDIVSLSENGHGAQKSTGTPPAGFAISGQGKKFINKKFLKNSYFEIFQQGRIFIDFSNYGISNDTLSSGMRFSYEGGSVKAMATSLNEKQALTHKISLPAFPNFLEENLKKIREKYKKKEDFEELQKETMNALETELLEIEKSQSSREVKVKSFSENLTSRAYLVVERKFSNGWGCYVNFL